MWTPYFEGFLNGNLYAVAVKKGNLAVGHTPRKISAVCSLFLYNGIITVTVRDSYQYSSDLPQGGLDVPYVVKLRGEEH